MAGGGIGWGVEVRSECGPRFSSVSLAAAHSGPLCANQSPLSHGPIALLSCPVLNVKLFGFTPIKRRLHPLKLAQSLFNASCCFHCVKRGFLSLQRAETRRHLVALIRPSRLLGSDPDGSCRRVQGVIRRLEAAAPLLEDQCRCVANVKLLCFIVPVPTV